MLHEEITKMIAAARVCKASFGFRRTRELIGAKFRAVHVFLSISDGGVVQKDKGAAPIAGGNASEWCPILPRVVSNEGA